jgi:hypothetical protein
MDWIVELEAGCWIAPWEGGPGRTLSMAAAKRFITQHKAEMALKRARKYRDFPSGRVVRT